MKNPNETQGTVNRGDTVSKGVADKAENLKVCHPSVCVGNQKPTSCVCITEK
jgi:hypothetical protein